MKIIFEFKIPVSIVFTTDGKEIKINLPRDKNQITVYELYKYMKEKWNNEEELRDVDFPIKMQTKHNMLVNDTHTLHPDSAKFIIDGSIHTADTIYTSIRPMYSMKTTCHKIKFDVKDPNE